jgi:hypothetical protein
MSLLTFNKALLGKWLWRYTVEREAFWQLVMDKKYGSVASGWCSNNVIEPYGVSLWKHIRRDLDVSSRYISIKVGDGSWTRFSHGFWCGNHSLKKKTFPKLFCIGRDKDAVGLTICLLTMMRCIGT